ncbi:DUF362 domain-containing protein [Spirochaetota bacterium]
MKRFVKKGDVVVIKPNIGFNRTPEQAATTNPDVVYALVDMCYEAGARLVKVFDNPCTVAEMSYENSGIAQAVKKAGGEIYYISGWKFYPASLSPKSLMNGWPIYRDAVHCDCFINVPIAKQHGFTGVTLSMKNLMGVCGGGRGLIHQSIDIKLAELTGFIKPDLTVIDAYRILIRNGPSGGNLSDVEEKNIVLASADPVLADAYATSFFNLKPEQVGYVKMGAEYGLGSMNIKKADIKKITA